MADIFDQVTPANAPASDVFDQAAENGDVFDAVSHAVPDFHNSELVQGPQPGIVERIRDAFSPLLGPTEEQKQEQGINVTGPDGSTQRVYKPMGGAAEQEGFFPALSKPAVPIPKLDANDPRVRIALAAAKAVNPNMPDADIMAAVANTLGGFAEFAESPLGVATGGLGELPAIAKGTVPITRELIQSAQLTRNAQRAVSAGFALDMGSKVGDAATSAGTASVTGTPQEKAEALLGLGTQIVLPAVLASHAAARDAQRGQQGDVQPKIDISAARPVDDALPPPVATQAAPPVPETPETLAAQVEATKSAATSKAATLVTPGASLPDGTDTGGLTAVETSKGTALVNPAKADPADVKAQLDAGGGGQLLGMSTDAKPAGGGHVLQTRAPDGTIVQDEVVTQSSLPGAIEAGKAVAPDGVMELKPAQQVIGERQTGVANIQSGAEGSPVQRVDAGAIATRPDLMQFKRMDNADTGVNAGDTLKGKWDDLKGGNLLLWEPKNPAEYGLKGGEKYIVANGHHRFEFGERNNVGQFNAQVVREADGYSAQDARALAAEINIADGKGTVYDATKFLRNESATHGENEALARAGRIGVKGGQAATIAFQAGSHLYDSFVNEQIKPDQAEAIARSAPVDSRADAETRGKNESLQRLGVKQAIDGKSGNEIANLIQAVKLEAAGAPAEQFDLFASDDTAIKTAEKLAKVASRIQGELSREIRATDNAARAAVTARAKGITFDRPPEQILAENAQLRSERDRWDNWALHPDLVRQVRGYAEMQRRGETPNIERRTSNAEAPPPAKTLDQKLQGLKIDTKGQVHAFGLLPAVWNGMVDAVRLAVHGGMAIADAVHAVIERFKAANPGAAFDEAGARASLAGMGERGFTEQLKASEDVASGIKDGVTNTLYVRRTNETDAQLASRLIQEKGIDGAIGLFADKNNDIPGSVRGMMGQQIIKQLSVMGKLDDAIDFHDKYFADHITDVAQTLQAQRAWMALTPEGQVIWAKKQMDAAAGDRLAPVKPDLQDGLDTLRKQNESGIRNTTAQPDVQDAARKAVDASVAASPEVHRAVVMELTKTFGESPYILNAAREAVRAKANELLNNAPRPAGFTAAQHLRTLLDDLAQRAAGIAANYFQGIATHAGGLRGLLTERLGIESMRAGRLATQLENEWKRQGEIAKDKLPQAIREVRAAQKRNALVTQKGEARAESAIDAAIRKQIATQQKSLGQIVHEHFTDVAQAGKDLADKLMKQSGLTGDAATTLANKILSRFAALTADAKARALKRILNPVERQGIARPGMADKLIKMSNLGALDDVSYWNGLKDKLNLPAWSKDLQTRLKAMADKIAAIPEDRQAEWQKTQGDFMNALVKAKGFDWFSANHAFFITNLLTGLSTHARVAIHTSTNLMGSIASEVGQAVAGGRVADIPLIFEAAARGGAKSLADQVDIMKSGMVTGSKVKNVFASRFHELSDYGRKGGVPIDTTRGTLPARLYSTALKAMLESAPARILNAWKYNDRLVTAQHILYYRPAEEMKVALLTSRMMRDRGLSQGDAVNEARKTLGYGAQAVAEANAQSAREGLNGWAARKRAGEILDARRPVEVREDAKQYALRQTFLNEPYGIAGAMAQAVENAKRSSNVGLARSSQVVAPFVRIAANLFNEGVNYSPAGAVKALLSRNSIMGMDVADLKPAQRSDLKSELYTKAALGTALFGGLAIKAAQGLSNPNPAFTIYGSGPSDAQDKARWRATGAIPWSVKIGDHFFSYANTPANVVWGALGNYLDRTRDAALYKRAPAERVAGDALSSATVALLGGGKVMMEQPFLQSLTELAGMTSESNPEVASRQAQKYFIRTASSAVVPNLLRQVDRIGDPTVYDQKKLEGMLTSAVPFVRREGQPVLNAFGQPLQSPLSSMFVSKLTDDPLVQTLNRYNVWPTAPSRNGTLVRGTPMTDDEWYRYNEVRGQVLRDKMSQPKFEAELAKYRALGDNYMAKGETLIDPARAAMFESKGQALPQTLVGEYDKMASERAAKAVIQMRKGN